LTDTIIVPRHTGMASIKRTKDFSDKWEYVRIQEKNADSMELWCLNLEWIGRKGWRPLRPERESGKVKFSAIREAAGGSAPTFHYTLAFALQPELS